MRCYKRIKDGKEHRDWFKNRAMADLLGEDNSVAARDTLYRCLDKFYEHKVGLFSFLKERRTDLFGASYDVLLYDLTSTYFEYDPPEDADGLKRFGYPRTAKDGLDRGCRRLQLALQ